MVERARQSYSSEQLPGHTLCDVNGKEIGLIMGVGPTYADVGTGLLHVGGSLYVPFDAITYCTDTRCYLGISIDQVEHQAWDALPVERPSTGGELPQGVSRGTRIPYRHEGPK